MTITRKNEAAPPHALFTCKSDAKYKDTIFLCISQHISITNDIFVNKLPFLIPETNSKESKYILKKSDQPAILKRFESVLSKDFSNFALNTYRI